METDMNKKISIQSMNYMKYVTSFVASLIVALLCVAAFYILIIPHLQAYNLALQALPEFFYAAIIIVTVILFNPLTLILLSILIGWKIAAGCWHKNKTTCSLACDGETLTIESAGSLLQCAIRDIDSISYTGFSTPLFKKYGDTIVIANFVYSIAPLAPYAYHYKVDSRDSFARTDAQASPSLFHRFKVVTVSGDHADVFVPTTPLLRRENEASAGNLESFVNHILPLGSSYFSLKGISRGILLKKAAVHTQA